MVPEGYRVAKGGEVAAAMTSEGEGRRRRKEITMVDPYNYCVRCI